jgi:hypothetical protein
MICYNHIVLVLLLCSNFIDVIKADNSKTETAEQRNGKVFSLFSIVSFPNDGCASQSVTGSKPRNGTCFTSTECNEKGGTVSGNCAAGFGVCCLFITTTSGSAVSENCSYIQNPNFPNAYGVETAISYTVNKCSNEVCTLRLDFETFTTAGPTSTSDVTAAVDTFQVSVLPIQFTIPPIGGENSGYHIYVEVGQDAGAVATLAFTFGTSTLARSWEIKVTQLECSNTNRPYDSGCLQYFTGTTGRIESFNYAGSNSILQHLALQNYNICIRKNAGYSCITYTVCDATGFSVSNGGGGAKSMTGSDCTADYLEIVGATVSRNGNTIINRFCGEVLGFSVEGAITTAAAPQIVYDCIPPYTLSFNTDSHAAEAIDPTSVQGGFCLEYNQIA